MHSFAIVLPGIIYGTAFLFPILSFGEQKSTAQYREDLIRFHDKEITASDQIAREKWLISKLKGQISTVDSQISNTVIEQCSILRISASDIKKIENEIAMLHKNLQKIESTCAVDTIKYLNQIRLYRNQLSYFKSNPCARLDRISEKIFELENLLSRLEK